MALFAIEGWLKMTQIQVIRDLPLTTADKIAEIAFKLAINSHMFHNNVVEHVGCKFCENSAVKANQDLVLSMGLFNVTVEHTETCPKLRADDTTVLQHWLVLGEMV